MCNKDRVVKRTPRDSQRIVVHYGTIVSGNQVMRDGGAIGHGAEDIDLPQIAPNGTAGAARAVVAAYPPTSATSAGRK
jgi:hypothetical protein